MGLTMNKKELGLLANNITQLARKYNTREGLDSTTDTLPKRFLTEPTEEGATLSAHELETMLAEYNRIRSSREGN